MDTSLQQYRCHAGGRRVLEVPDHVVDGVGVLPLLAGVAVECTEDTVDGADIGVVRVGVDQEGHLVFRILPETDFIGEFGEIQQLAVAEQPEPLFPVQPFATIDLCRNIFQHFTRLHCSSSFRLPLSRSHTPTFFACSYPAPRHPLRRCIHTHDSGSPCRLLPQANVLKLSHELHKSFHGLFLPFTETVIEAGQEVACFRVGQADVAAV